jgi:hypothetical protein
MNTSHGNGLSVVSRGWDGRSLDNVAPGGLARPW